MVISGVHRARCIQRKPKPKDKAGRYTQVVIVRRKASKGMELLLKRIARKDTYTIGRLFVDGVKFCDTLEPKDRGLQQSLPLSVNMAKKKKGATAIPVGRYRVTLDVKSPRFSKMAQYKFCNGYVPRILNVPAFDGVCIHIGNTAKDTEGCPLVGENKAVGKVLNSTATYRKFYDELKKAKGYIYITVE